MRIFLYEFVTAGGTWSLSPPLDPAGSLAQEGIGMLRALAEDFRRLAGVQVLTLCDRRLSQLNLSGCEVHEISTPGEELAAIQQLAARAEWILLIAPEFDGLLAQRCRLVESVGGRLLSPDSGFVELASDKHRMAQYLAAAGVSVLAGVTIVEGERLPADFPYPAVLKPVDGAGSRNVRLVQHADDTCASTRGERRWLLEPYRRGLAASVSLLCGPLLCGPGASMALEPCGQKLSEDGRFRYLGGYTPLPDTLRQRALQLARRVADCLPPTVGYVGIDMVLAEDGPAWDVVIEINPRLTTSYLGLRRRVRGNLAQAMLGVATGQPVELSFDCERVEFAVCELEPLFGAGLPTPPSLDKHARVTRASYDVRL